MTCCLDVLQVREVDLSFHSLASLVTWQCGVRTDDEVHLELISPATPNVLTILRKPGEPGKGKKGKKGGKKGGKKKK